MTRCRSSCSSTVSYAPEQSNSPKPHPAKMAGLYMKRGRGMEGYILRMTNVSFWPPKPKLLERQTFT